MTPNACAALWLGAGVLFLVFVLAPRQVAGHGAEGGVPERDTRRRDKMRDILALPEYRIGGRDG